MLQLDHVTDSWPGAKLGDNAVTSIDKAPLPPGLPAEAAGPITRLQQQVRAQAREIAWCDAKLEKGNLELARLKCWKFVAKTDAMTAQQRAPFDDALPEAEASLRAQPAELQRGLPEAPKTPKAPTRQPCRAKLREQLEHVEHRHERANTNSLPPECCLSMQRIGEGVREELDIVPAKCFVDRHIHGKWVCKCKLERIAGRRA